MRIFLALPFLACAAHRPPTFTAATVDALRHAVEGDWSTDISGDTVTVTRTVHLAAGRLAETTVARMMANQSSTSQGPSGTYEVAADGTLALARGLGRERFTPVVYEQDEMTAILRQHGHRLLGWSGLIRAADGSYLLRRETDAHVVSTELRFLEPPRAGQPCRFAISVRVDGVPLERTFDCDATAAGPYLRIAARGFDPEDRSAWTNLVERDGLMPGADHDGVEQAFFQVLFTRADDPAVLWFGVVTGLLGAS
jgi:hypothetical protein